MGDSRKPDASQRQELVWLLDEADSAIEPWWQTEQVRWPEILTKLVSRLRLCRFDLEADGIASDVQATPKIGGRGCRNRGELRQHRQRVVERVRKRIAAIREVIAAKPVANPLLDIAGRMEALGRSSGQPGYVATEAHKLLAEAISKHGAFRGDSYAELRLAVLNPSSDLPSRMVSSWAAWGVAEGNPPVLGWDAAVGILASDELANDRTTDTGTMESWHDACRPIATMLREQAESDRAIAESRDKQPVTETSPKPQPSDAAAGGETVTWRDAQAYMEKCRLQGDRFTSQDDFSQRIGCSVSTVNKAIKKGMVELQDWASKQRGASRLNAAPEVAGVMFAKTPQGREPNPADALEAADVDAVMAYLLDQACPDERARINAMTAAEKRQLAETVYRDPDEEEQVLRHRRAKHSQRD